MCLAAAKYFKYVSGILRGSERAAYPATRRLLECGHVRADQLIEDTKTVIRRRRVRRP